MRNGFKKEGFTLVEILTTLAIIGIMVGVFYTTFFLNWESFEGLISQADLAQETDQIVESMSEDGHAAHQINVVLSPDNQQAIFEDVAGNVLETYTMNSAGEFHITRNGNDEIVSNKVDFLHSTFNPKGSAIAITLTLNDDILGHTVSFSSATEVYPRN